MTIIRVSTAGVKRRKQSPLTKQQKKQHKQWLATHGITSKTEKLKQPDRSSAIYKLMNPPVYQRPDSSAIPSKGDGIGNATVTRTEQYEGEMKQREKEAQKVSDYNKKCVAPICNKGGLAYITPGIDPKTVGRKI